MNAKKTLRQVGPDTYQIFRAARPVDGFGFSGGSNHSEWTRYRWEHWLTSDLVRSASDDKPFWCAEMPAGYSWRSKGTPMDRGRMATPNDIRLFSMTSFAGGATGIMSPRWRPLLNGRHTGNFGFYDMAGNPTDRSEMAAEISRWANHPDQADIWKARPVRAEIGMVVVPESQIQCWLLEGDTRYYYHSIAGAYQGFLFNNIQVDFVNFDEINDGRYDALYLPHPLMLPRKVADALKEFVRRGGILISEGCPAYYGDHGRAGENQPNYGLDELFGAREARVEFTPVLHEDLKFNAGGSLISGGVYLQSYVPTTGAVSGTFEDGSPAVIDHVFGRGKTRLIGTCPGYGYYEAENDPATRNFFGGLLEWSGKKPHVKCSDLRLVARLHEGDGYRVLWMINSAREAVEAQLEVSEAYGSVEEHKKILNRGSIMASGRKLAVSVPARDVAVIKW
jgi:beta-galactosidase